MRHAADRHRRTMDHPNERTFTIDEANALLPRLRESLTVIRDARRTLIRSAERVEAARPTNGGGRDGAAHWEAARLLRREVEALAADDIVLRDGDTGLIDFPALREGRRVFLCWRLGEPAVGHWHEVDSGFGGRKPL